MIKTKNELDSLIHKCLKKDSKAQKRLYDQYASKILGIIYRYVPDYHLANDVLQITFIRLFKNLHKYNGTNFDSWLIRIAINASITEINKNKKYRKMINIDNISVSNNLNVSTTLPNVKEILSIINSLPSDESILFNLKAIDGYSFKEISETLNISQVNARVRYHRIKKKLSERLKDYLI